MNYHPADRFKDNSILVYELGKLVSVFPAAIIHKDGFVLLKSHPGSSYGGFVIKDNIGVNSALNLITEFENYSKANKINKIEFRLQERIFNQKQIDEIEFALKFNNWKREAEELSTFYNLDNINHLNSKKSLLSMYSDKAKTNYYQSLKNGLNSRYLKISEIELFYTILKSNLEKHKTQPVHSESEIYSLMKSYPNRVRIHGTFRGDELLSAFLIFAVNKIGWHIFYSALDYSKKELLPIKFGLTELLLSLKSEGSKVLNYGISTENSGKIVNYGLFNFKESFGGQSALRTYWGKSI